MGEWAVVLVVVTIAMAVVLAVAVATGWLSKRPHIVEGFVRSSRRRRKQRDKYGDNEATVACIGTNENLSDVNDTLNAPFFTVGPVDVWGHGVEKDTPNSAGKNMYGIRTKIRQVVQAVGGAGGPVYVAVNWTGRSTRLMWFFPHRQGVRRDPVVLFEKENMGGRQLHVRANQNLNRMPRNWNDRVMSARVPKGMRVKLYEGDDLRKKYITLGEGDHPNVGKLAGEISSVVVELVAQRPRGPVPRAYLFKDANLKGGWMAVTEAKPIQKMLDGWDDAASSAYVPPGHILLAYNSPGLTGECQIYTPGSYNKLMENDEVGSALLIRVPEAVRDPYVLRLHHRWISRNFFSQYGGATIWDRRMCNKYVGQGINAGQKPRNNNNRRNEFGGLAKSFTHMWRVYRWGNRSLDLSTLYYGGVMSECHHALNNGRWFVVMDPMHGLTWGFQRRPGDEPQEVMQACAMRMGSIYLRMAMVRAGCRPNVRLDSDKERYIAKLTDRGFEVKKIETMTFDSTSEMGETVWRPLPLHPDLDPITQELVLTANGMLRIRARKKTKEQKQEEDKPWWKKPVWQWDFLGEEEEAVDKGDIILRDVGFDVWEMSSSRLDAELEASYRAAEQREGVTPLPEAGLVEEDKGSASPDIASALQDATRRRKAEVESGAGEDEEGLFEVPKDGGGGIWRYVAVDEQ